ncbi:MAG: hypothetical protein LC792_18235 [Actinobacteria bacterium]|nr:hypothetical protein [Actinomycetota bacterium]
MNTPLTVGGLGIGLAILGTSLWTWWKSPGRDPKNLAPFASGFCLGALATICTGGILGVLASWTAGLNNKAGGSAVPTATGSEPEAVARGTLGTLTPGGALVVFLLAVGFVIAWRAASKKELKRRMFGGWWSGVALSLSAGAAGVLAETLLPIVNGSGETLLAWFNAGGGL